MSRSWGRARGWSRYRGVLSKHWSEPRKSQLECVDLLTREKDCPQEMSYLILGWHPILLEDFALKLLKLLNLKLHQMIGHPSAESSHLLRRD